MRRTQWRHPLQLEVLHTFLKCLSYVPIFLSKDSVWGGTGSSSLYQSNHTTGQQQRFETVTSGKKKKKQKMVRADPSLLGEIQLPDWRNVGFFFLFSNPICWLNLSCVYSSFRFLCECVIWEIEYGRNWDFGGLLRDWLTVSSLNSSCSTQTPAPICSHSSHLYLSVFH